MPLGFWKLRSSLGTNSKGVGLWSVYCSLTQCVCLAALQGIAREWVKKRKLNPFDWSDFCHQACKIIYLNTYFEEHSENTWGFCTLYLNSCVSAVLNWLSWGFGFTYILFESLSCISDTTVTWLMCDLRHKNSVKINSDCDLELGKIAMRFAFHSLPCVVCLFLKDSTKVSCIWEPRVTVMSLSQPWMRTCYDRQLCKHSMK